MNSLRQILLSKNIFIITLLVIYAGLVVMAPKAAVNVDEQLHFPHAKKVVNWYFTGGEDKSCFNTPRSNLKYYGQSVDNITALVSRVFKVSDEFLLRHYTGALCFGLLLFFGGLITRRLSGSWIAAVAGVLALAFMPRLAGQAFGNLKDIPFATGYLAAIYFIILYLEELPSPRWKTALSLGIAIAFTISVRIGGLILFAFLGFFLILFFTLNFICYKEIILSKSFLSKLAGQGAVILITGYFGGLLFWPYALQNVFVNPLKSLNLMEHYSVSIRQIFEGEMIWSAYLPWHYLPKWILISTPLFVLSGFLIFLCFYIKEIINKTSYNNSLLLKGLVLFSFLFPPIYVVAIGSNLYSGLRQMLFILPPLAILSVIGIYTLIKQIFLNRKVIAYGISGLFLLLLAWPFRHQFVTFPADYIYFNAFAGGNRNAWSDYEYDYYFHGMKEPAEYMISIAGSKEITVAMNCNLDNYFYGHPNIKYQYTRFLERSAQEWDYGLFGINYIHPHLLKNDLWQPDGIVKIFYHRGNPLAVLVKRRDNSDINGIRALKEGDLESAAELLEKAMQREPNNLWLYVNLAKTKLKEGDIKRFNYYLNKGKEIFPCYEPFLLLEAKWFYDEEKYEESIEVINKLLKINPYYKPGKELYNELSAKLK